MNARRLPNGNLLVPMRAETEGAIGDCMIEIGPDHPDFKEWEADLRRSETGDEDEVDENEVDEDEQS